MEQIFISVQQKLKNDVVEVKWIDFDFGQLDFYKLRPAVAWPCVLIDLDIPAASDRGKLSQLNACNVIVRVAFEMPGQTHQATPQTVKDKAMNVFDILNKIWASLHGHQAEGFNAMLFRGMTIEKREDPLKVYQMRFETSFERRPAPRQYAEVSPDLAVTATISM